MFSTPGNFSDKIKEQFMDMLVNQFNVVGANLINQTLLMLYSYSATSGIVIDIGERLEIVPVTDGKNLLPTHALLILGHLRHCHWYRREAGDCAVTDGKILLTVV